MTSSAPHQALYRRWRAQTFAEIVGQEAVVETLRNAVRQERVAHAILFVGPRGTGKTSLARILAKALNCTDLQDGDPCDRCPSCVSIREGRALDLVEIDAASNRGIDAIRELRERIHYAPTDLRRKVYILDEAHQITKDAWNALLKSLEEPPEFVVFMFASTHPQEFPPAILSRLQRFDVRRLSVPEIEGKLNRILAADDRAAEPAAIHLIARLAAGGMRDAESMLDQLLSSATGTIDERTVRELLGLADAEAVDSFVDALVRGDVAAGLELLDRLEERGRDVRVLLEQVVEAIRGRIVDGLSQGAPGGPDLAALAGAARRLGAIDPTRASIGGLRLQLELALFPDAPGASSAREPVPVGIPASAAFPAPARTTPAKAVVSAAPPAPAVRTRAPQPAMVDSAATAPTDTSSSEAPTAAAPVPPPAAAVLATDASTQPATDAVPASAEPDVAEGPGSIPTPAPADAGSAIPPAPTGTASAPEGGAAPTPQAPAGGDLETLRARWPDVVARISQHPPTKPLIAACRPISVEGNVVTLGFPEDQAFLRDVAERRRQILEQGVGEFLGRSVAVRCVATNLDLVPIPGAGEDSAALLAEARRIFAEELVDVGEVS